MKDDATIALERYFSNDTGNTVYFHGSIVRNMLTNGVLYPGDAPDLVITYDNVALIIEHFENSQDNVPDRGCFSYWNYGIL